MIEIRCRRPNVNLAACPAAQDRQHRGKPAETSAQGRKDRIIIDALHVPARFLRNTGATRVQYGALCWRLCGDAVQVLLVTSRDTGRWIIPKGWPIADLAPPEAAAREAWEEAGVEGSVAAVPVGLFAYEKIMGPDPAIPCLVSVYPLRVARLRNRFPEARQRQRRWFTPAKAAKKVIEPDLRLILNSFTLLAPPATAPAQAGATALAATAGS